MSEDLHCGDPRVRLAGERTLLAWIRTGLAMMAFGFVVARFGFLLHEIAPQQPDAQQGIFSLWVGTALILLGVLANVLAALGHYRFLRRLVRGEPEQPSRWSLSIVVSVVLALGGIVMAAYLIALPR